VATLELVQIGLVWLRLCENILQHTIEDLHRLLPAVMNSRCWRRTFLVILKGQLW
jgi:hypothetical protein